LTLSSRLYGAKSLHRLWRSTRHLEDLGTLRNCKERYRY